MERPLRQNVAVLMSESTRRAFIDEARARDMVYRFESALGGTRHWLKGPYAYLAPNGASTVLHRLQIKHDVISDDEAASEALDDYDVLVLANAASLPDRVIANIVRWLGDEEQAQRRLVVTGLTNLPPSTLGLTACERIEPAGFTEWRFTPDSPFSDTSEWPEFCLSGYRGYPAQRAVSAPSSRVLAELWQLDGDISEPASIERRRLGDGVVLTDRTLFIANQVFEYIGGAIQAQMDVDAIRDLGHASHYLDTLVFFIRGFLRALDPGPVLTTQLRAFGTYEGMIVLRHDADVHSDEALDLTLLDWQIENSCPATYVILDPDASPQFTSLVVSKTLVDRIGQTELIEAGLHNDSHAGVPPTYISGRNMLDHFQQASQSLGVTFRTAGRHYGFHMHPETLDAMDLVYERLPELLGMCTFSVLQVIEYGETGAGMMWLDKPISYSTRFRAQNWTCGAVPGWWFPHHVVISTIEERKTLRGWDSTKESECDYDRIDELLAGSNGKRPGNETRLPNAVFTIQYHPQNARKVGAGGSTGSLDWIKYLCVAGERHGFGLATKQTVYERLTDYESVTFRLREDGSILLRNPTSRPISGLVVQAPGPVGSASIGDCVAVHIVADSLVTLPTLAPNSEIEVHFSGEERGTPVVRRRNSRELEVLSGFHDVTTGVTELSLRATAPGNLGIERLEPGRNYRIELGGFRAVRWEQAANEAGILSVPIPGPRGQVSNVQLTVEPAR